MRRPTLAPWQPQSPPPSISYSRFNSLSSPLVPCLDRVAVPPSASSKKMPDYHPASGVVASTRKQQWSGPDCERIC
ncbi:hypothetical protein X777_11709 [Ooceraea biroi]|uniref:Uncharacterized protein n=1 Tax=Ooceraea biroi TaxID=2015173 RepID=A0A026W1V1_OOCBI|nr:hypothetical protein X777_11709 [Ooceraea biroi]